MPDGLFNKTIWEIILGNCSEKAGTPKNAWWLDEPYADHSLSWANFDSGIVQPPEEPAGKTYFWQSKNVFSLDFCPLRFSQWSYTLNTFEKTDATAATLTFWGATGGFKQSHLSLVVAPKSRS